LGVVFSCQFFFFLLSFSIRRQPMPLELLA
jgi:hypothetical protein